jgi:hypothetical protein
MRETKERYSMTEVASEAGVSYDRLMVFLKTHGDRIPFERQGRRRFFPPRAIEAVREIARESKARHGRALRRKPREKAAADEAMGLIGKAILFSQKVTADLQSAYEALRHNQGAVALRVQTLHPNTFRFKRPMDLLVEFGGPGFAAHLIEVKLSARGDTRQEAVTNLRALIVETYRDLKGTEPERWTEELQGKAALLDLVIEIPGRPGDRHS